MVSVRLAVAFLVFSFSFFVFSFSSAQTLKPADFQKLSLIEDTLVTLSDSIVLSANATTRMQSSQALIRTLVRALRVEGSYAYPFSDLQRVAVVNAPDKKFRIFNWGMMLDDGSYRYYGTIQMNDKKQLTMFPLIDHSHRIVKTDTVTSNEKWYGALYYKIIQKKKHYYLFGWNANNAESNKKLVDVLWFDGKGKPRFGAPHFVTETPNGKKKTFNRYVLEYRKDATVTLNYDPEFRLIIHDHLVPPDDKATGMFSFYIPDGSYQGFVFKKGKWQQLDNVWTSTQSTPFPKPLDFEKETLTKPRSRDRK